MSESQRRTNRTPQSGRSRPDEQRLSTAGWVAAGFLLLVFLSGGGSRSDIASLPLLRGAAVIFACWAMAGMQRADWQRVRVPLALLAALTLWIGLQLVPLPPSLWQGLPSRDAIVAIDRLLGQPDIWRPISLTPSDTWNSLLAMTVPIAALLLMSRVEAEDYSKLLTIIVAIAFTSALLGFIQLLSGAGSTAYIYRITNSENMVGLFANRNHHACFQACAMLMAATLLRDELMRKRQNTSVQVVLMIGFLLFTAMTMLIGSRAGLVLGFVAFVASYAMLLPAWRGRPQGRFAEPAAASASRATRWLGYLPLALMAGLLVTVIRLSDRTTSLTRLDYPVAEDLRLLAWPTVQDMMSSFWLLGSGFGSFPDSYKMFEPDSLLQPNYFNHAHNDWAELIITGGLPFVLIVLAGLIWIGRAAATRGFRNLVKGYRGDYRLALLVVILSLAAASVVDYPLRVPSLQVIAIITVVLLCCPAPATPRATGSRGSRGSGD